MASDKNSKEPTELLAKEIFVKTCVFGSSSKLTFQNMAWMTISDFVNIDSFALKKLGKHFPSGMSSDREATFIGKTRSILSQSKRVTDQIGTVKRSSRKMEFIHQSKIFEIQQFLVMGIKDMNNCEWKKIDFKLVKEMPKYALRVGKQINFNLMWLIT